VSSLSRSPLPSLGSRHQHYAVDLEKNHDAFSAILNSDYIFHAASSTTPGSTQLSPKQEASINIYPILNLLAHLQNSRSTLVFISSGGGVYDTDQAPPYNELSLTGSKSYYGAGKLAIENFLFSYNKQTSNPVVVLRPSNIYGPGQKQKMKFGLVPKLLAHSLNQENVEIWGDGAAVRDYLYIDDFLLLCSQVISTPFDSSRVHTFNVGKGQGHSILDLCSEVERVTNNKINIEFCEARGVDARSIVLDCTKARDELNWIAETDLPSGLSATWSWFQQ